MPSRILKDANYTKRPKFGTSKHLLKNNRWRVCRNMLLMEGITVPRNNKLLSLKLNPNKMKKNSTFQIANNKRLCQNSRQHKTIQIIQSTCFGQKVGGYTLGCVELSCSPQRKSQLLTLEGWIELILKDNRKCKNPAIYKSIWVSVTKDDTSRSHYKSD